MKQKEMINCPDCEGKLQDYFDSESGFTQYICWKCGYYASNSPAYRLKPKLYTNLIRDNPSVLKKLINRNFTERKTTDNYTAPIIFMRCKFASTVVTFTLKHYFIKENQR